MPRTNAAGKTIKSVLQWLLNTDLTDTEMATALGLDSINTFKRHREADSYPNYEQLDALGRYFNVSPRMLQIAFAWRALDELVLLTDHELDQYIEQGGQVPQAIRKQRSKFRVREDAPPLH
jgi:hypothetical protein